MKALIKEKHITSKKYKRQNRGCLRSKRVERRIRRFDKNKKENEFNLNKAELRAVKNTVIELCAQAEDVELQSDMKTRLP
jgi:hypothetical protein